MKSLLYIQVLGMAEEIQTDRAQEGKSIFINERLNHEHLCSITFVTLNDVTTIVKLLYGAMSCRRIHAAL